MEKGERACDQCDGDEIKKKKLRQVWTTLEEMLFRGADMKIEEGREDIGDIKK